MPEMLRELLHFWFPGVKAWRPRVRLRSQVPLVGPPPLLVPKSVGQGQATGPLVVGADRRPLWQVRRWQRKGQKLVGAFRTPRGSIAGMIKLDLAGRPTDYYLINPPESLLNGPKRPCFRARGNKWYWVHFARMPRELDGGIVAIESLIRDALATEGKPS